MGPVPSSLKGTLKVGDSGLGKVWGRVRAMTDYRGKRSKRQHRVCLLNYRYQDVPTGDDFVVVNQTRCKNLVGHRIEEEKQRNAEGPRVTLEDLIKCKKLGETKTNLIIKSDVGGTLEAMKASLDKISEVEVRVIHGAVGNSNRISF